MGATADVVGKGPVQLPKCDRSLSAWSSLGERGGKRDSVELVLGSEESETSSEVRRGRLRLEGLAHVITETRTQGEGSREPGVEGADGSLHWSLG